MSTWHPISTAPKDRPIALWNGLHHPRCYWDDEEEQFILSNGDIVVDPTHWREPDNGPGMEEGEVRWMVVLLFDRLGTRAHRTEEEAISDLRSLNDNDVDASVVRVRIVREEG